MNQLPSLENRPAELYLHRWDVKWSRHGQKIALEMANYIFSILMIPEEKQKMLPRVLAFPCKFRADGSSRLPMSNSGAIFYETNYIALHVPPRGRSFDIREYSFIENSPVIGKIERVGRLRGFKCDLAHEMSHWAVDRVLHSPKDSPHGKKWRLCYGLLREKFVNR